MCFPCAHIHGEEGLLTPMALLKTRKGEGWSEHVSTGSSSDPCAVALC